MKDKILIISTPSANSIRELELMEKFSNKSKYLKCPKTDLKEINSERKDHCVKCSNKFYKENLKKENKK